MGFGSDCLTLNSSSRPDCGQQDAATHSVTQQYNSQCNISVQHKSGKQCNTVEQPVDGQVSGPQVFRKSDHLSPCCPRPTPTDQRRVRKLQFSNSFTWSSVNIKGLALAKIILLFFFKMVNFLFFTIYLKTRLTDLQTLTS